MMSAASLRVVSEMAGEWWLGGGRVHPVLRLGVYLLLYQLQTEHKSFLGQITYAEETSAHLRVTKGVWAMLGLPYPMRALRVIKMALPVAWMMAAAGFFGRISGAATAAMVSIVMMACTDMRAQNHSWFLAWHTLIGLAFSGAHELGIVNIISYEWAKTRQDSHQTHQHRGGAPAVYRGPGRDPMRPLSQRRNDAKEGVGDQNTSTQRPPPPVTGRGPGRTHAEGASTWPSAASASTSASVGLSGGASASWIGGVDRTGFARQYVLCMAVAFYFASGWAKIANTGMSWFNGDAVCWVVDQNVHNGQHHPLAWIILRHREVLCPMMGFSALVVEVRPDFVTSCHACHPPRVEAAFVSFAHY